MGLGGKGKGGGGGLGTITLDTNVIADTDSKVEIVGLDNIGIKTTSDADLKLATNSDADLKLAITEPIRTDSRAELDVKPLAADLCLRFEIGKLPSTKICKPFDHHVGISLFGVEVLGFDYVGEKRTVIEDLSRRPQVLGPDPWPERRVEKKVRVPVQVGGLNVRLGP